MKALKRCMALLAFAILMDVAGITVFAGEWKTASYGWWYQNNDGSYPANGWQWIDGRCYCFDQDGYCLIDTITPDGYLVDESGAWTVDGVVQTKVVLGTGQDAPDIFVKSAGDYHFSSGVGAWGTSLTLGPDGSFTGSYHDEDMEGGVGYQATVYQSRFHGRFKDPVAVDSHIYRVELDGNVVIDSPSGQYIEDGILYINAEPYGMEAGREFYIYLPGTPLAALPEAFVNWVGPLTPGLYTSAALPCFGLYNAVGQYGFIGER